MLRAVAFVLIALCIGEPAFAATRDIGVVWAAEKRVALVIGNAAYPSAPLKNPVNDARAMATTLRGLGFEVIARENATQAQMQKAVLEFGEKLSEGSVGLVYYSGHGMQVGGKNYLIPVDADISSERAVPLVTLDADTILVQMADARSRVNLVILDACRNNPFERKFRGTGGGLAQMSAPTGTLVAYSTAPGKVASDGTGANGLYTQELLKAIRQPGLPVEEVFKQVRTAVRGASNDAQTPWESSSLEGQFYFTGAPTPLVTSPATAATPVDPATVELAFWDTIKASSNPADFKAYLDSYPNGRFAALARTRVGNQPAPAQQIAASSVQPVSTQQTAALPTVRRDVVSVTPPTRTVGAKFRECADCPEMIVIPPGSFIMGSPPSADERFNGEKPQHQVTIPRAFAVGTYDVTFDEWDACVNNGGCAGYRPDDQKWGRGHQPVMNVNWEDAQTYVQWLNRHIQAKQQVAAGAGNGPYRLPSEAEWEYVARAGTTTAYYWGDDVGVGNANCDGCGPPAIKWVAPVGSFPPNAFGLYDMAGNLWQWTADCFHDNYAGAPTDGSAWTTGECRGHMVRGGTYWHPAWEARVTRRSRNVPDKREGVTGFRVARTLD